jgi:peptidoglycan/LPS O-acetylase OafA/YrhL
MFLLGSVLYVYRKNIFISTKMIILILGLLLGSIWLGYHHQAWFLFSPYIIISVAILLPLSSFSKYGDFSYGIYVYAFPVQQVIVFLLYPNIGAKRLMVYAFVPTLILAILSWKFIEKPALGLKNKLFVDRYPKN